MAKSSTASILQRFVSLNFLIAQECFRRFVLRLSNQQSSARIAGL
jgi:hypothetical protein